MYVCMYVYVCIEMNDYLVLNVDTAKLITSTLCFDVVSVMYCFMIHSGNLQAYF